MGKRSGVPHRDEELAALSIAELQAELTRAQGRLTFVEGGAKAAKQWQKRIHWLEATIANRA